jgi:hypothetical protein
MAEANLLTGWIAMLVGILSGAVGGLFFHRDDWMGGYGSYRRRLARLGHISFFGLGFLNLIFGLSVSALGLIGNRLSIASTCLIVGAITMPLCCFLSAWRKPLRHLFPIPVIATLIGVMTIVLGSRFQ